VNREWFESVRFIIFGSFASVLASCVLIISVAAYHPSARVVFHTLQLLIRPKILSLTPSLMIEKVAVVVDVFFFAAKQHQLFFLLLFF